MPSEITDYIFVDDPTNDKVYAIRLVSGPYVGTIYKYANIKISGSGDVDMANIKTDYVSTKTSGSGTITVWADKTLDINISGSGNVYYYGNPIVNTSISGSGRVIKN